MPTPRYTQKIDKKNAWNLNLIDHMEDMVVSAANVNEDGSTNYAAAGSTIDAGIKIYSSRVDSVHAETYKVLSNLSRSGKNKGGRALLAAALWGSVRVRTPQTPQCLRNFYFIGMVELFVLLAWLVVCCRGRS